jgi:TetR/AcrR family transcriptional regulator, transcriptional repressor for nem operon
MKTPATMKGQQAKAAITATAARMMHDRGMAATSLDDVLAASGAGKSQMYHYFKNKGELTKAVLHHQFERIMAAQPSLTDEAAADLTQWRAEVLEASRVSGHGNCPLGAFAGQVDGSPELRAALAGLFESWRSAISALVRRSQRAGLLAEDVDPEEAGFVLLAALEGGAMLAHLRDEDTPLVAMLDSGLSSIGVPPPAGR